MSNYQLSKTGAEIDAALELAVTHETTKANKDGTYPDLTAGEAVHSTYADFASQIETDREIDDAEEACPPIVFGTVGGNAEVQNGLMKFPELRGHTIKWNQLMQNGNFVDDSGWGTNDSSISVSSNVCTLTATAQRGLLHRGCVQVQGHKYMLVATIKLTTGTTDIRFCRGGSILGGASVSTTEWQVMSYFYDGASTTASAYIGICDNRSSDWDAIQVKNFQLFDLTAIYGSGNEPSTVAEFVRDFPMPYYAYNAGTLLSSESASLISVGKNQCPGLDEYFPVIPGETYEVSGISAGGYLQEFDGNLTLIKTSSEITSATDITLDIRTLFCKVQATTYTNVFCYILWSTPGESFVEYESTTVTLPNLELRSAGDYRDVAYQTGGGKRRAMSVTIDGSEGTDVLDTSGSRFAVKLAGIKRWNSQSSPCPYILNNYYANVSLIDTSNGVQGISVHPSMDWIMIYDSTYTGNLAGYKTWLSTHPLTIVIALATETDITTTENPGWDEYIPVDNFGTLIFTQSPAQDIPVPQAYFIRYTVNPVEFLDALGENAGWDADNVALKSDIVVPDAPTTDGTYTLKVTVSNGTPTYSWIAD